MDGLSGKITFEYKFTSTKNDIQKVVDATSVFQVEGIFIIKIDDIVWFYEDIPLLELYLYLERWQRKSFVSNKEWDNFEYYSLEYEEKKPILEIKRYHKTKSKIRSVWKKQIGPVLDAEIVGKELNCLCNRLGKDIEQHFEILLKTYINRVPMN